MPEINYSWDHIDNKNRADNAVNIIDDNHIENTAHKKSVFFWVFIFGFILMLLASIYAGLQYYLDRNSVDSSKINMTINIDEVVRGGTPGEMQIGIVNSNKITLREAKLRVTVQKGFSKEGVIDQDVREYNFADMVSNVYNATSSPYLFVGSEGDSRKVMLALEYKVPGSNSVFVKNLEKEIKIVSPSLIINAVGPKRIIEDHEYYVKFIVKNVSYTGSDRLAMQIKAPPGFAVKKEDGIDPFLFDISNLKVGQEKEFGITGFFKNNLSLYKNFSANISTADNNNLQNLKSLISETSHEVELISSPINYDYKIMINGIEQESLISRDNSFNSLQFDIENIFADYITDIVVIVENSGGRQILNKESNAILERINPKEIKNINIILPNVQVPTTNLDFEIYGTLRGESNSILLKNFKLTLPAK
jgi:hypothetical protein